MKKTTRVAIVVLLVVACAISLTIKLRTHAERFPNEPWWKAAY